MDTTLAELARLRRLILARPISAETLADLLALQARYLKAGLVSNAVSLAGRVKHYQDALEPTMAFFGK